MVVKMDNDIISWGDLAKPDTIYEIENKEKVEQVHSSDKTFLVQLSTGEFLAWGSDSFDENEGYKPIGKRKNSRVFSNGAAFAIISRTGNVITLGDPKKGGEMPKE